MFKPLAALVLSTSIGLSGMIASATPAKAIESDVLGQLIFGAAAVAVISKIYNDRKDDDKRAVTPTPPVTYADRGHGHWDHGGRHAAKVGAPARRIQCRRKLNTERGWVRFYSQACLDRVGSDISVPRSCLRQRWQDGRWVQYFNRRCLKKYGKVDDV